MLPDEFDEQGGAGGEAAIRRALVDMMLRSTWHAVRDKDFEYALEYVIAVLSIEKNQSAAYALGAVALSFFADTLPRAPIQSLLEAYLAGADEIRAAPFDDLDEFVSKEERLVLLAHARALASTPDAMLLGFEDFASRIVFRIEHIIGRIQSRSPSGEILSALAPDQLDSAYSAASAGEPLFYQRHLQDFVISHMSGHGSIPDGIFRLESLAVLAESPDLDPRRNPISRALGLSRAQLRLLLLRARIRAARSSRSFILSYRRGRRR